MSYAGDPQLLNRFVPVDSSGNAISGGSSSGGVTSVNSITGTVTIAGAGSVSVTNAGSTITVSGSSAGSVTGPGSSTTNALSRFSDTTGQVIKNSTWVLDDSGNLVSNPLSIGPGGAFVGKISMVNNQITVTADDYVALATNSGSSFVTSGADTFLVGVGSLTIQSPLLNSSVGKLVHGNFSTGLGAYSYAGGFGALASGNFSHAEGQSTQALGVTSHAEGTSTSALTDYSHAEGFSTISSGLASHSEGQGTQALAQASHAQGINSIVNTIGGFAAGSGAVVNHNNSVAFAGAGGVTTTAAEQFILAYSNGVTLSNTNLVPATSGTNSIGTLAAPFASGVFANYLTPKISGTVTAATSYVNWSNGAAQTLAWVNGQVTGTTVVFSGMTPGSTYTLDTVNNASGTGGVTAWPTTVKWQNGVAGTITSTGSSIDMFTFYIRDTGTVLGNSSWNYL